MILQQNEMYPKTKPNPSFTGKLKFIIENDRFDRIKRSG